MSDKIQSATNTSHENVIPLPAFEPSKTKLLTINQVCERLSITRQTLDRIIKRGDLKTSKFLKRGVRISEFAPNELINSSQNKGE